MNKKLYYTSAGLLITGFVFGYLVKGCDSVQEHRHYHEHKIKIDERTLENLLKIIDDNKRVERNNN